MKRILLFAVAGLLMMTANAQWIGQDAGFVKDTLGFYEISVPNKNTAWAVCYDGKFGLNRGRFILDFTRTTDGGATWTPGKMGNDHTLQFSNISAISENEAWVAMNKRFTTGGGLYHTTDGGATWTKSSPDEIFDENSFPNFVHFNTAGPGVADNKGIAMGDPNGGYFEVYTTMNSGKKWKRVPEADLPAALPGEFGWISGYAAVGETIWFGTSAGRMYKTENFGKDWTVHTVDPTGKFVMEIAFNDDKLRGVAHLRNSFGQTFLYSTTDGGVTWTNLGQPANWKSSRITAVPGTNAFVSTAVNNPLFRGSAISYDNGVTWTELERATSKAACRFYDASTGYAGGFFVTGPPRQGGIFKSQIVFEQAAAADEMITANAAMQPEMLSLKSDLLKVYPTPAKNVVTIVLPDALVSNRSVITLLSMNGKVIESTRSSGSKIIQRDVSRLPAGSYTVRITTNTHTISKIITIVR